MKTSADFMPHPATRRVLSPFAQKLVDLALTTKFDYIRCQAAAWTFIALSNPEMSKHDIVQLQANADRLATVLNTPVGRAISELNDKFVEPLISPAAGAPIEEGSHMPGNLPKDVGIEKDNPAVAKSTAEIEAGALKIATEKEWNSQLTLIQRSKLLIQEDGEEPTEDLFLHTAVRHLIEQYQAGTIDRQEAISSLKGQSAALLQSYSQWMILLRREMSRSFSEKKVCAEIRKLHLTNGKEDKREKDPIWPIERGEGAPDIRVLMGTRFRKPFRTVFITAVLLTVLTGGGCLVANNCAKGLKRRTEVEEKV